MKDFAKLLHTGHTVWTTSSLQKILEHDNLFVLRNKLSRAKKEGVLQNPAPGIRTLPHYSVYELANVLHTPSYISLETVLAKEGIVFQSYDKRIFCISSRNREKTIGDWHITYHKIQVAASLNPLGIVYTPHYAIATVERALCDRLYLTPDYYFDNLHKINRTKALEIAEIYSNKRLLLDVINLAHAQHSFA